MYGLQIRMVPQLNYSLWPHLLVAAVSRFVARLLVQPRQVIQARGCAIFTFCCIRYGALPKESYHYQGQGVHSLEQEITRTVYSWVIIVCLLVLVRLIKHPINVSLLVCMH
jgi:hypothetical protein